CGCGGWSCQGSRGELVSVAVGDGDVGCGSGDGDVAAVVGPVVIRAQQHQVVQFGGSAVFPVPYVVGVQTAGRAAAGHGAGGVAVFQSTTKPAVDGAGGASGAERLAVAFEPHFAGGVAGQVLAVGVGEQRPA